MLPGGLRSRALKATWPGLWCSSSSLKPALVNSSVTVRAVGMLSSRCMRDKA